MKNVLITRSVQEEQPCVQLVNLARNETQEELCAVRMRQMRLRIKKANWRYEKTRTVRFWVVIIQKTLVVWKFNFSRIDYQMLLLLI